MVLPVSAGESIFSDFSSGLGSVEEPCGGDALIFGFRQSIIRQALAAPRSPRLDSPQNPRLACRAGAGRTLAASNSRIDEYNSRTVFPSTHQTKHRIYVLLSHTRNPAWCTMPWSSVISMIDSKRVISTRNHPYHASLLPISTVARPKIDWASRIRCNASSTRARARR